MTTASYVEHAADALVGRQEMEWFWNHYVDVTQREHAEVSPLRAPDVSGLPPAIVAVAEFDPLRDDGLAYAERLRAAGTDLTLRRYDDVFHGFFSMVNVFVRGNEAVEAVGGDIRRGDLGSSRALTLRAARRCRASQPFHPIGATRDRRWRGTLCESRSRRSFD